MAQDGQSFYFLYYSVPGFSSCSCFCSGGLLTVEGGGTAMVEGGGMAAASVWGRERVTKAWDHIP